MDVVSKLAGELQRLEGRVEQLRQFLAQREAHFTELVEAQHDLVAHLNARLMEAVAMLELDMVNEARTLLDTSVSALDRLRLPTVRGTELDWIGGRSPRNHRVPHLA